VFNFFAKQAATETRLLKRSCEKLLGMCSGMLADGELSDYEILFLNNWLTEHDNIADTWPGEVLYERIRAALADGVIDDSDRSSLLATIKCLIGGTFQETGTTSGLSSSLPVNAIDGIDFSGKVFCFTGEFLFGTREACHRATERVGGLPSRRITQKLNYLVIGTMSTRSFSSASFGRKIEKAVDYQKSGSPLLIVDEATWVRCLPVECS
jgi:NAD-dependent DNA ligase